MQFWKCYLTAFVFCVLNQYECAQLSIFAAFLMPCHSFLQSALIEAIDNVLSQQREAILKKAEVRPFTKRLHALTIMSKSLLSSCRHLR